ncbi:CGG triplet repeat-binding protein 1-like [Sipha flava]|uniref:CGG triplet repeat-binding protein 1-like n=1 Tax=Sipha flava TaxID=143950 RepID=A0A8B8GDW2_9HEMI|nr:CGG triplet repeat-binding protein 1-like [Sipha flava]
MPKVQSESAKLRQFVEEFSSNVFKTDGKILYCIICDQAVPVKKRFQVVQHLNRGKHNKNINLKAKSKQSFIKNTLDNQNKQANFPLDLYQAMLESDIPLWKLNHPSFKKFLEKYTGKYVPDQSAISKNYVSAIYENTIVF